MSRAFNNYNLGFNLLISTPYHLLLEELEGEVVLVFNELVFAPIVEAVTVVT